MLDNCPGMRGEVSGVETRLKEVQPDLLPLGGDTVHMCHTATKELLKPLDGGIEAFLKALWAEFRYNHWAAGRFESM